MVGSKQFVGYVRAEIHFGEHAHGRTVYDDRMSGHDFGSQLPVGQELVVLFGT